MRPADRLIWDLWTHLRDVEGRFAAPKLVIYDGADVVDGWGLPMKAGRALISPESRAGWGRAHFDHMSEKLGEGGHEEFEPIESSGKRIDVLLSFPGAFTYGHWFIDILSRVEIALTCFDMEEMAFVVPGPLPGWAVPFLSAYSIGKDRLVELGNRQRYRSATLAIPSLGRESDYLSAFPHGTSLRKLKAFGIGGAPASSRTGPKLLVRHKPQTSTGRRATLSNFTQLERSLAMRGFVTVYPAEMPREDQIAAFAHAKIIVGEDSSALHNIVYSSDARLIVINSADRKNLLHLSICELLGHTCHYVFCEPEDSGFECDIKEIVDLVVRVDQSIRQR